MCGACLGPHHGEELCYVKAFGFYPGRNGESMETLKWGTDMIR